MPEEGPSGDLWPVHVKPQEDELLSSWLVRLARGHGVKLHTFCSVIWPGGQVWNRDIDKCAGESLLSVLTRRTGTSGAAVAETTLRAYQGRVYEKHNPLGNTTWIMPVGVYHRTRKRFGLQFCPRCLAEAAEPYYRRSWRLAFVTFCEIHHVPLFDRCPQCRAPVNFHRYELGDRNRVTAESITLCYACRYDLRETSVAPVEGPAECRVLEFQKSLTKMVGQGWAWVEGHGAVYSHLYFTVLRQMMKVFATGRRATALRECVNRALATGTPAPTLTRRDRDIERLGVGERRKLLDMALYLLTEWPWRFIHLCKTYRVWSAALLRELNPAPFWYWRVIHDHLYRIPYTPSDEEIRSAIAYLNRRGIPLNKKHISRCLGTNNDVFRKRKTQFPLIALKNNG